MTDRTGSDGFGQDGSVPNRVAEVPLVGDARPEHAPHGPSRKMVEALVCPASGGPLEWHRETDELVSRAAGLAYPIRSGIPIMLVDEARALES